MRRLFCLLLLFVIGQPLQAATLGFSIDNDFFTGQDSHYTNGVRLAWLSDAKQGDSGCAWRSGLCALPGISGDGYQQAWSIALQQIMVTPSNIERETPDYSDLPYVGFSQLDIGVYGWNQSTLTGYGFRLGVIGKESGAARTQEAAHKLIGSKVPQGWDNQLGPATVGGVYAYQSRRLINRSLGQGYGWTLDLAYGLDINNFVGAARTAVFFTFGHHALQHFIPDFTGLSTSGAMVASSDVQKTEGWAVFSGLLGSYEGYNYIVRHAPDAYGLTIHHWPVSFLIGVSRRWHSVQAVFTLRASNSKLENENAPLSYGNFTLLWHY